MTQALSADPVPAAPEAELSRVVRLDEITNSPATMVIDATMHECISLAERFELPYVRNLSAEITYRRVGGGQMLRIDGRISATFGQLCASTMTPMVMTMEESFQSKYTLSAWEKFSEFDLDQPEILTDDFLDLGEVAAQYFGLAIDPYAQRPSVETLAELTETITDTARELIEEIAPAAPPAPAADVIITINGAPAHEEIALVIEEPEAQDDVQELEGEEMAFEAESELEPEMQLPEESLFFKYLRRIRTG